MMMELRDKVRYTGATAIVDDVPRVRAPDVGLGDMVVVKMPEG